MKNRKKLKGPADGLLGFLFPAVLLLVMIINLLVPDRAVSETENRALAEKPQITLSNAVRRDFAERYENYASDQFVGRDMLRSVKVSLSRLGGSHMENGVYIGKNGRLFEEIQFLLFRDVLIVKVFLLHGFIHPCLCCYKRVVFSRAVFST